MSASQIRMVILIAGIVLCPASWMLRIWAQEVCLRPQVFKQFWGCCLYSCYSSPNLWLHFEAPFYLLVVWLDFLVHYSCIIAVIFFFSRMLWDDVSMKEAIIKIYQYREKSSFNKHFKVQRWEVIRKGNL